MAEMPIDISKGFASLLSKEENSKTPYASKFLNMLVTQSGANVDRPALSSFCDLGTFPANGLHYFPLANKVVAVTETNRKVWAISEDGSTEDITGADTLEGDSRPVFEEDGTYLAIAGGGAPKQWSGSGDTEALAGSPDDTKFISYLDGYWISHILDDQEFRFAGPTAVDRATWSSANFFQAESNPDQLLAQAVIQRQLFGFGTASIEIFQNTGDSSVPFRRSYVIDEGLGAAHSIVKADNSVFWFDAQRRFVRLEGNIPVQKSTAIQNILDGLETVDDCWGSFLKIDSFNLVMWAFPTEQRCFVLDLGNNEWYEWDGFENGESQQIPIHAHVFVKTWNKHLVSDPNSGLIYELSRDAKADGARVLRRLRRTGQYSHGTSQRKRSNYYLLDIKRGVGTNGEDEPTIQLRVNDDNQGWSQPVSVPLGYPGESQNPIRVTGLRGIYRKRELEWSITDDAACEVYGITEDVEVMG
jgi:hypothetical protein